MTAILFDRGQVLGFMVTVVGLYLALQVSTPKQRAEQVTGFEQGVEAFGIAVALWAVISALRAPLIAIAEDRRAGQWFGPNFVYKSERLLGMFRVEAGGKEQSFRVIAEDAEPLSYVRWGIDLDAFEQEMLLAVDETGASTLKLVEEWAMGGWVKIAKDKSFVLRVSIPATAPAYTVRVTSPEFSMDPPS